MDIRLIALDLDGTLNNDEKQITPRTRQALMQVQRRGVRLALASARPSPGLSRERDALRLQDYGGILMSYNGGRIVAADTGKVLFETAMDREVARGLLRRLEGLPVTPILDDGVRFYVTDRDGYMVQYECWNNGMECEEVEDLAGFLPFAPVKILMSVQPEQLRAVQARIAAMLPEELTVVPSAAFYLEIMPRTVNKGQGIRDICRVLGLDTEQVVAFGDAANDIPMLRQAGFGVAMGNARPEVRAAAKLVTDTNNADGIAAALERLGLLAERTVQPGGEVL